MTDELLSQIAVLREKAGRYMEHAKKIKEAVDILSEVMKEIDPYLSIGKSKSKTGINYKEVIAELLLKMRQGTQVTSSLIMTTYGYNQVTANYIMQKIKATKGVQRRKQGATVYLYFQNEM
jgi:hypothetical protein